MAFHMSDHASSLFFSGEEPLFIGHRKCLDIRKGAWQKWFKFRALWFWRHFHGCVSETDARVPRVAEIEAAAATSIVDHDIVKSSWKYRLLCCCVTRDVTQSNGLQEGSSIFLFSVSCFDEEVIFFIYFYFCREIRKEHERTRRCLALRAQHACSNAPGETPFPEISLLEYLDSSAKMNKKKETILIWSTMSAAELDLQD